MTRLRQNVSECPLAVTTPRGESVVTDVENHILVA